MHLFIKSSYNNFILFLFLLSSIIVFNFFSYSLIIIDKLLSNSSISLFFFLVYNLLLFFPILSLNNLLDLFSINLFCVKLIVWEAFSKSSLYSLSTSISSLWDYELYLLLLYKDLLWTISVFMLFENDLLAVLFIILSLIVSSYVLSFLDLSYLNNIDLDLSNSSGIFFDVLDSVV